MIFHCGQCQAKYQLPDERVAGKTVRMKCRKCSNLIEVKGPPKAAESSEPPAAPEGWFAGIDGQPTGPMTASELAKKVDAGSLSPESLVWREGQDGWKPFHAVAELMALTVSVQEGKAEALVDEPPASTEPELPISSKPVSKVASPRPSVAAIPRPPPSRPSQSSLSRSSAAPKLEPTDEPTSAPSPAVVAREPISEASPRLKLVPEAAPKVVEPASEPAPSAEPDAAGLVVPLGLSSNPPPSAPAREMAAGALALEAAPLTSPEVSSEPVRAESRVVAVTPAPQRGRVHPAAWAVVGLGGVLIGIFAGLSMAGRAETQPEPVNAPVAAQEQPAAVEEIAAEEPKVEEAAEPKIAEADEKADESEVEPEPQRVPAPTPAKPKAAAPAATASSKAAPAMTGLSNLSGLAGGPTAGPSKSGTGSGKGALSQAEVERVVQSHRAFVKRRCWELALATKTQGAPSSARVATSITIAPDGRVTNASASGGEGYPGLASCVAGQVRGWKFPPSEGGTVNVPFVFAAQ